MSGGKGRGRSPEGGKRGQPKLGRAPGGRKDSSFIPTDPSGPRELRTQGHNGDGEQGLGAERGALPAAGGTRLTGMRHACRRPEKGPCSSRENFTLERSSARDVGDGGRPHARTVPASSCTTPAPPFTTSLQRSPLCGALVQLAGAGPQNTASELLLEMLILFYPNALLQGGACSACSLLGVLSSGDLHISKDGDAADTLGPCSSFRPSSWDFFPLVLSWNILCLPNYPCCLLSFHGAPGRTASSLCPPSRQLKAAM